MTPPPAAARRPPAARRPCAALEQTRRIRLAQLLDTTERTQSLSQDANAGWLIGGLPPALLHQERRMETPVTAGQSAAALQLQA